MYSSELLPTAPDDVTAAPVSYIQYTSPLHASSAYTYPSPEPTNNVSFASRTGDDVTVPFVSRLHTRLPFVVSSAYTFLSDEPKNTVPPSELTAADE
jgi:hypothetical protein